MLKRGRGLATGILSLGILGYGPPAKAQDAWGNEYSTSAGRRNHHFVDSDTSVLAIRIGNFDFYNFSNGTSGWSHRIGHLTLFDLGAALFGQGVIC
jgi:hypothetical protein